MHKSMSNAKSVWSLNFSKLSFVDYSFSAEEWWDFCSNYL